MEIYYQVYKIVKKSGHNILPTATLKFLYESDVESDAENFAMNFVAKNKIVGFDVETTILKVYK